MEVIYLFQCPGLSAVGKAKLKRALPRCEILFENPSSARAKTSKNVERLR
jgi:hypothetical protein